jgi:cardiolipin synthase
VSSGQEEVVLNRVFTIPNLISFTRMLLIPLFAWVFLTGDRDGLALGLLIVIGCTDWVDGFVARKTGQVSRLGKLLDPVADRMAIIVVLLALVFRDTIPVWLAAALLLRDLIVSIAFPILEAKGFPRLAVNWTGKWATALIFTGMGFAAASVISSGPDFARTVSVALLVAGAVLYWTAGVFYVRELRRLILLRAAG